MKDLTIIYLTANEVPSYFQGRLVRHLRVAVGDTKIIAVSKRPFDLIEDNIVFDKTPRSHTNIYYEALQGAKMATTEYIGIAEDDTLYSPIHFRNRPKDRDAFAYNIACWGIYTWTKPPVFSHRSPARKNHNMLICRRQLYIDALTERFNKYPDHNKIDISIWAEPGKYEKHLKVKEQKTEVFYTNPANVMFSHEKGLSFAGLGEKKRHGEVRAYDIPHWGRAEDVLTLYR